MIDLQDTDVVLVILPFFHGYGFGLTLTIFQVGAAAVTMTSFEPEPYLEAIGKYRVTILPVAPPLMNFFAKHPLIPRYDYSSVREVVCGAAPLSPEVRPLAITLDPHFTHRV